jgi:hypothetical protein
MTSVGIEFPNVLTLAATADVSLDSTMLFPLADVATGFITRSWDGWCHAC